MPRHLIRILSTLTLILLASLALFVSSGYYELQKASTTNSASEAAQHYRNAAQRLPWRADLYELVGHTYYRAEEYAQADIHYQKALSHHALSPQGWVAWGDVNYLNDNPQRALEIWEQALEQKDPADGLYLRLAKIYQTNGELSKAAAYLQRHVSIHPQDAAAHYRLGLLLVLSDTDQALTELVNASQLDREFDPAVRTIRTALNLASLNDSDSQRFVIVGRGLGLVAEWKLASAMFRAAVEADEENAEAWAWLGEAKQQTDLSEGGAAELERALALDPTSPTVRGLRGLYFQRAGNFRQALAEFQSAAELEPSNPAWFVSIGESQSKLGDLIRALEAYQAATDLAPKDPGTWRLLAIFCAQNNVYVHDVGVPAAQKVVELGKEDPSSLDLLGWSLALDSRYWEAKQTLGRALELDSKNVSAHLHLGIVYMEMEEHKLSYDHLIQARDLGSEEAKTILDQYFP